MTQKQNKTVAERYLRDEPRSSKSLSGYRSLHGFSLPRFIVHGATGALLSYRGRESNGQGSSIPRCFANFLRQRSRSHERVIECARCTRSVGDSLGVFERKLVAATTREDSLIRLALNAFDANRYRPRCYAILRKPSTALRKTRRDD